MGWIRPHLSPPTKQKTDRTHSRNQTNQGLESSQNVGWGENVGTRHLGWAVGWNRALAREKIPWSAWHWVATRSDCSRPPSSSATLKRNSLPILGPSVRFGHSMVLSSRENDHYIPDSFFFVCSTSVQCTRAARQQASVLFHTYVRRALSPELQALRTRMRTQYGRRPSQALPAL